MSIMSNCDPTADTTEYDQFCLVTDVLQVTSRINEGPVGDKNVTHTQLNFEKSLRSDEFHLGNSYAKYLLLN